MRQFMEMPFLWNAGGSDAGGGGGDGDGQDLPDAQGQPVHLGNNSTAVNSKVWRSSVVERKGGSGYSARQPLGTLL
jgi:hypothetical protein